MKLTQEQEHIFTVIAEAGVRCNQPVYVIGGFVRDYYLKRRDAQKEADIDFVTVGSGIDLALETARLLNTRQVSVFRNFGTAHIRYGNFDLEFVGARRESYDRSSRKPFVENGSLQDDQKRRDFTINAMSWSLSKGNWLDLIDPFGGMKDLEAGIIRTPLEPAQTYSDDPLRMMRAVRFAAQLQFHIEQESYDAITAMARRLEIISKERILEELNKIILAPVPSRGFKLLFHTGLLGQFSPEMIALHGVKEVDGVRHKDNFWHTLQVLDNISEHTDSLWLRWAAIMHDIGKPPTQRFSKEHGWTFHGHDAVGAAMTKRIFRRLGLPMDERLRYVQKLVRLHLRPIALANNEVSDSAVRRLIFEAGNDIDDLMTLCRADITSKNDEKVQRYLRNFDHVEELVKIVEEKDQLRNFQPPVDGLEIMEKLGLKPGPAVGEIKDAITNAILDGEIPNEREAALAFMYKTARQQEGP
ncbi:CCA tRNA nucleotidyltransferase [Cyclonatronum proteinivorum]|uniref:CCA tRNA nucleotidyltransferase n=1 Tax=Cyclonatronum proteinivorum TaxID=1457365 RepID=UPI0038CC127F